MWTKTLAWIRKVPLAGWLALALAAVWVVARRAMRQAATARLQAGVTAKLLDNRRALFDANTEASKTCATERGRARSKLLTDRQRLLDERVRLNRLSGRPLADEINAVFSGAPQMPQEPRK